MGRAYLHDDVLLTTKAIDSRVGLAAIPVALDLAQILEGLTKSDKVSLQRGRCGRDSRQETQEDHADHLEEDCRTEHFVTDRSL